MPLVIEEFMVTHRTARRKKKLWRKEGDAAEKLAKLTGYRCHFGLIFQSAQINLIYRSAFSRPTSHHFYSFTVAACNFQLCLFPPSSPISSHPSLFCCFSRVENMYIDII
jgi:hypothetical protein